MEKFKIIKTIRLGGRNQDQKIKPRVLLVQLEDTSQKSLTLNLAKNLRKTEKWKQTYIAPDMTKQQREERRKLRVEMKRRREEGEENLTIRRGRLVTYNIDNRNGKSKSSQGRNTDQSRPQSPHQEGNTGGTKSTENPTPTPQDPIEGAVGGVENVTKQ